MAGADRQEGPLLAIVPARGGSTSLPRKNMRTLGGRPLVAHTVSALERCQTAAEILISTDDHAVATWAELHGHTVHRRSADLSGDEADLGELAATIADELDRAGVVGVFPPTSPFRSPETIDAAVTRFRGSQARSLSACERVERVHWHAPTGDPDTAAELSGPIATPLGTAGGVFRENGALYLVESSSVRTERCLITGDHLLFEMSSEESLRVSQTTDLVEARRRIGRGTVVFRVRGEHAIGSGHVFHSLELADELADQDVCFLLKDCDPWVEEMIRRFNYSALKERDLATDLASLADHRPRLVVNDVLDTIEADILIERSLGFKVVNIEDLGPGSRFADWVVNALYRPDEEAVNTAWGPRFATLRDEFHDLPPKAIRDPATDVLVTFGGTDPAHLASRCARLLAKLDHVNVHVILGPGAADCEFPSGVEVSRTVPSMAQAMLKADIILTSAGRTVYESARTGTPVIVLAQNAREATHAHLGYKSGVVFLGIGPLVADERITEVVARMLSDVRLRQELSERLRSSIDDGGTRRVGAGIRELLTGSTWK